MKKLPSFWETDRLIFYEITEDDTDFIVTLRGDPNAYKYFLAPHPLQRQEHINWFREKYLKDDFQSSYIAKLKTCDSPIGIFSAKQTDICKAEISYILSKSERGRGFASEAVTGLEYLCKQYADVSVFTAQVHIDNAPSIKLVSKLGYFPKERSGNFITFQKL